MANDKKTKIKVIDIIKKSDLSARNQAELEIKKKEENPVLHNHKEIGKEAEIKAEKEASAVKEAELKSHIEKESVDKKNEAEEISSHKEINDIPFFHKRDENKHHLKAEEKIYKNHSQNYFPQKKKSKLKSFALALFLVALIGGGYYAAVNILPRVEIKIVTKKANWDYNNSITINPKIADIDALSRQVPAAVFYQKKNQSFSYSATGQKYLERKATGKIIIYNESNTPQVLVAGTRMQSPDGKIFKLKDRIVVPFAGASNGSNSIEVDVIAEKAGDAYNIGPISKFTIPGFAGSDKFKKFYGESKSAMAGGFIGNGQYPTKDDIAKAKSDAENQIKDVLISFLRAQALPQEFKIIENSKQIKITKEAVNEAVDDIGNFSVIIEAEGSLGAVKESQVIDLMAELAKQVIGADFQLKSSHIEYGDVAVDLKSQVISLPVKFSGSFWKPVDVNSFKSKALDKSEDDLKALVFSYAGIEKADISFWPFWVKSVPNDSNRVKVELQ